MTVQEQLKKGLISDQDFERIFVGNYQRSVTHFYSVPSLEPGFLRFAYGYLTPDGVFHQGTADWSVKLGEFI